MEAYPMVGTDYFVIIGMSVLSFSKISGITLYAAATKGIHEGGRYEPYIIEEQSNELHTMTLEKGYGTIEFLKIADQLKNMILIIKGPGNTIQGAYYTGCVSIKDITVSELDASKSNILIQTMTIAYTNLKKASAITDSLKKGSGSYFGSLMENNGSAKGAAATQVYSKKLPMPNNAGKVGVTKKADILQKNNGILQAVLKNEKILALQKETENRIKKEIERMKQDTLSQLEL